MKPGLKVGTSGTLDLIVGGSDVIHLGSSQPVSTLVFCTPSMINLMEHAAREALRPFLDDSEESVGVNVVVEHLAATPINSVVRAEARVTAIEGRLVDFEIVTFDEQEQIGRGTHRRAVIQVERFVSKLIEKTSKLNRGVIVPSLIEANRAELSPLKTLVVERDGPLVTVT